MSAWETQVRELAATLREGAGKVGEEAAIRLQREFDEHAEHVFGVLRRVDPVIANRAFAVVTRHADVLEVLDDHAAFSVHENGVRMRRLAGPFILGEDDSELYRRHAAALRRAVRRQEDAARVREHVAGLARARLDAAAARGWIDVVGAYADPVLAEAAGAYLGAPGPDAATQARWAKDIFHELFINVGNVPGIRERAEAAAAQMRTHLDGLVAHRRADGGQGADDLLGRLLALEDEPRLDDREIRDNLLGLITGWIPTASKALVLALVELMERPAALASARTAALDGDLDGVRDHVWEALRFRPQNSGLLRRCESDRVIAAGTPRETTIRRGSTVFVATQSAMMDRAVVEEPGEFRPGRPPDCYLHFGHGLHTCWGKWLNEQQLPVLAAELLKRPGLRAAEGAGGDVEWDGPYPGHLLVSLTA